jgi:hypothetical protein
MMKPRSLLQSSFLLLVSLTLSSCQLDYSIKVFSEGGRLTFRFATGGWLERSKAPRINYLAVEEVSQASHHIWKLETIQSNGPEVGELSYGEVPRGLKQTVKPEKLRLGQLYRVTMFAVDGGGEQSFIIADTDLSSRDLTILR